jgi:hypothetical protein
MAGMEQTFLGNGFTAFLGKPFKMVDLHKLIEKYVIEKGD